MEENSEITTYETAGEELDLMQGTNPVDAIPAASIEQECVAGGV